MTAIITATTTDGTKTATVNVTVTATTVAVKSVSINKRTLSLVEGTSSSTALVATVTPQNATDKTVSWSSDYDNIATVVDGLVTAQAKGDAIITATTADGTKTATVNVTVTATPVHVTAVSINEATLSLVEGASSSTALVATVTPQNATDDSVIWTSNNPDIATVVGGQVTALAEGTAIITATTTDGRKTATVNVTVTAKPRFTISSSGTISNFSSNISSVVIPASIGGVPVTSIGRDAFKNKNLTSVTIPDSMMNIGIGAFASNSLTSVTIPDSVTSIDRGAFLGNKLTSVIIPNTVTSIGNNAFRDNKLTTVTIPDKVTSIGDGTFYSNSLTSVDIPNSVTSIGQDAFRGNKLTSVDYP